MVAKDPNSNIQITSLNQCMREFDILKAALMMEETEDTWQKIDASLKRFTAVTCAGACDYPEEFLKRWKEIEIVRGLTNAMLTERTRLSGSALDLISATSRLGFHWDSAIPLYAPTLIKLLGRASKIYVTRASGTLNSLVQGTKSVAFIPFLVDGISEKSLTTRIGSAEALLSCLRSNFGGNVDSVEIGKPRSQKDLLNKRVTEVESAIKAGGRDRDPRVRAIFKQIWELYERRWPHRAVSLSQPFTPTIKRHLGISLRSAPAASAAHPAQVATVRHPTSQTAAKSGESDGTASCRERLPSGSQPARSLKSSADAHSRPASRGADATMPSKRREAASSHSNAHDLATLRKAASIPLPPDQLQVSADHPKVPRTAGRAALSSSHPGLTSDSTHLRSAQAGSIMKRSNSTMRAQRVPLASQLENHPKNPLAVVRTAGRVPFQALSCDEQPTGPEPRKVGNSLTSYHAPQPTLPSSNGPSHAAHRGFKPSRTPSNTLPTASAVTAHPAPLPTRPLPKRATPTIQDPSIPPTSTLNVSLRSRTRSQSSQPAANEVPVPRPTRRAFKPTKAGVKDASIPVGAPDNANHPIGCSSSKESVTATSTGRVPPTTFSDALNTLPEALRIPALTPLPDSPSPSSPPSEPLSRVSSRTSTVSNHQPPEALPTVSTPKPLEALTIITTSKPLEALPTALTPKPPEALSTVEGTQGCKEELLPCSCIDAGRPSIESPTIVTPRLTNGEILQPGPAGKTSANSEAVSTPAHPFLHLSSSPAPKICTKLPEDLIVPMSIPLPPSPNSPFVCGRSALSNNSALAHRKEAAKTPSASRLQRSIIKANFESASACVAGTSRFEQSHSNMIRSTVTNNLPVNGPSEGDGLTQPSVRSEGILVDFDHEDTVWIPRPPSLHGDLAQLATTIGFISSVTEEVGVGPDGPNEKRPRLETTSQAEPAQVLPSGPGQHRHFGSVRASRRLTRSSLKRDTSDCHSDRVADQLEEVSDEKTVSCLKEQPDFLAGDITVNDGRSFFSHFLSGITAQNQSTPASGVRVEVFSRLRASNSSP